MKPRCGSGPATARRATTWATPSQCRAGRPRRSRSTKPPCGSSPPTPRPATTSPAPCSISAAGAKRSPAMKRRCGSIRGSPTRGRIWRACVPCRHPLRREPVSEAVEARGVRNARLWGMNTLTRARALRRVVSNRPLLTFSCLASTYSFLAVLPGTMTSAFILPLTMRAVNVTGLSQDAMRCVNPPW